MDDTFTEQNMVKSGKVLFKINSHFPGSLPLSQLLEQIAIAEMRKDKFADFDLGKMGDSKGKIGYNLHGS